MAQSIEHFYDDFSATFVKDFVRGNRRNDRQHRFFHDAVPPDIRSVLVIGCGSGQGSHYLATHVAPQANILAVDISAENLRLAGALFPHPRVEYRKVNVVEDALDGQWELIVLPDVYEHIPKAMRATLHARMDRLLAPNGRILITVPTPAAQAHVLASGGTLQIVDEPVTLADLMQMAADVQGVVTFFAMVSIWRTDDYIYAVVEREGEPSRPLARADKLPVKGHPHRHALARAGQSIWRFLGVARWQRWRRERLIRTVIHPRDRAMP